MEKRYEDIVKQTAEEALTLWQRDAEAAIAKTVSSIMQGVLASIGQSLGAKTPAPRIEFESIFGADNQTLNQVLQPFEGQVNSWLRGALSEATTRTKTTTRSSETARSQNFEAEFRASRGQAQAQALAAAERGRRNS